LVRDYQQWIKPARLENQHINAIEFPEEGHPG
jgi:hypothetical protein